MNFTLAVAEGLRRRAVNAEDAGSSPAGQPNTQLSSGGVSHDRRDQYGRRRKTYR